MEIARIPVPSKRLLRYLSIGRDGGELPQRLSHRKGFSLGSRRQFHNLRTSSANFSKVGLHLRSPSQTCSRSSSRNAHALTSRFYSSTSSSPDTTSYYTLFPETLQSGSPPNGPFLVDAKQLRHEYLRLQALHHPDKYPPNQKRQADALSSLLGEAYRTLTDPLRCAQYLLLTKYDIDMNAESAKSSATDMEMLNTVMEAQEAATDATSQAEVDTLNAENDCRIQDCVNGLVEAFQADDAARAHTECTQLKYWTSLRDALRNWEPGKEVRLEH